MKKLPLLSTVTGFVLLLSFSVNAQNDSARLDAGSMVLKRAFTQHVSIKGKDLEKMPFSTLSDAINVWLNGVYTINSNLIFVVDGNIVSDVNAYSIHDIEEVVLLQNAGALAGTAGTQNQMVLITTRKAAAGLNIRGAAQTMLVHRKGATTNLYHQYFAGVDGSFGKFNAGVSMNYLRDVFPMTKSDGATTTPLHMDRWRLNGNIGWTPDTKNTIELHVGFVPETLDSTIRYGSSNNGELQDGISHFHENDRQFNTWARWRGEWLPGLRNDLQTGYLYFSQRANYNLLAHYQPPNQNFNYYNTGSDDFHTHQFFVRDRLSYTVHSGGWSFEPAVNASYLSATEKFIQNYYIENGPDAGTQPGQINGTAGSTTFDPGNVKLYVLTPTLDISFKQVLNIQAGMVSDLSHRNRITNIATLPRTAAFGSIAIDLLKLGGVQRDNSLKIFGSYSQRSAYTLNDYYVNDIDNNNNPYKSYVPSASLLAGTAYPVIGSGVNVPVASELPKYWAWDAGASWKVLHGRLQFDYNYERRNFSRAMITNFGNGVYYYMSTMIASQHRLGISCRVVDRADVSWQTGLNITTIKIMDVSNVGPLIIGDKVIDNKKPSFTGGWVNRIQTHGVSFGLDLLYHFSGEVYRGTIPYLYDYAGKRNFWLMQNVFIGYKVPMHHKANLELYIESRGLTGGGITSYYTANVRKYYGVGANVSL